MSVLTSIRTDIIPDRVTILRKAGPAAIDHQAICVFVATGFFLEGDTYYRDEHALQPATVYDLDSNRHVRDAKRYWSWHYTPRDISLSEATEEFAGVFERITRAQIAGHQVILPLSGGLDSRTQAVALRDASQIQSYSYRFADSFDETSYGQQIADRQGYEFRGFEIPKGYLWRVIDELAGLNGCHADFTHPRQMAVIDELAQLGDLFFLGHWGDVLFDDMGVRDDLPFDAQVGVIFEKIVKRGGAELATALWQAWGLEGAFAVYLRERIAALLRRIEIDNANARIRAFKSVYWAPRWTTTNLVTFSSRQPIALPYYHADMCKFVCTIPERHLAGRQIQIEYIKRYAPRLASVRWQAYEPHDLYSYKHYHSRRMLPYRAARKVLRMLRSRLSGTSPVTRNWENQFLGSANNARLRSHLFDNASFAAFVPREIVERCYAKFAHEDHVSHAHPLSMLLTLSVFANRRRDTALSLV